MTMKLSWPTRITILRIFLVIPFVSLMLKINDDSFSSTTRNTMRYVSIIIFLVMAVSDGIDGYLARKKIADKLLITCACILLASRRAHVEGFLLPSTVVVLIVGKDLFLMIGFTIVYLITQQIRIAPVFIGKLATTLQLSMVAGILIAPEVSHFIPGWIWFLRVLWWSVAGTAILATLIYIRNGSRYIEDYEQTGKSGEF